MHSTNTLAVTKLAYLEVYLLLTSLVVRGSGRAKVTVRRSGRAIKLKQVRKLSKSAMQIESKCVLRFKHKMSILC